MTPEVGTPLQLRVCVDVDSLDRGVDFYSRGLGLRVGRRFDAGWVEMLGAPIPIDLVVKPEGSAPVLGAATARSYTRHWTPVHLDFVTQSLDADVQRAVSAGAKLEWPIQEAVWGRMANLADPFGHGLCLLEFTGRGYDALLSPAQR